MRPWNPHAQTFHGEPITGRVPVRVVVRGPEMTPQQGAMLQAAYASFAAGARLSIVPNPSVQGSLPDGSQYTIDCVNGVCTCVVRTVGGGDDMRRSGVVIALSDLDGNVLEGHHTDGVPTRYLLTPKAKTNRDATGKWLVRKLREPWDGGKAVQSSPNGKKYFTGIEGRSDRLYPYVADFGSINERAYTIEDREVLSVRQSGDEVFLSNDTESPVPFILQQDDEEYAAQLVFRELGGVTTASLYVGPLEKTPGAPVGELVDTVTFPSNVAVRRYAVSVRNDGREARAAARDGLQICNLTLHIAKDSLTYTLSGHTTQASTQYQYDPVIDINEGTNDGYVLTKYVKTNGNYVDLDGITKGSTGKTTQTHSRAKVFAFGPKGQETDFVTLGYTTIFEGTSSYEMYETTDLTDASTGIFGWSQRNGYEKTTIMNGESEIVEFVGTSSEAFVYYEKTVSLSSVTAGTSPIWDGVLTERRLDYYGYINALFYDRYQQFAIYLEIVPPRSIGTMRATGGSEVFYPESHTTEPEKISLKVKHKTGLLINQRLTITTEQPGTFTVYVASDPLTAALVVNLMRVKQMPSGANKRLASWVFLVDESGVKTIKDVMPGLPDDVCAIENRLLYSL